MKHSARTARRGLVIYLVVVVVLTAPLEVGIVTTNALAQTVTGTVWISGLMLVPTVASAVARWWTGEGFADLGFRRGRGVRPALVVASALPFGVGVLAYGFAWLTGLTALRVPPLALWAGLLLVNLVLNLVLATGEELGWRGYMLPRMVEAGVPWPVLVSSLVWGLWHVPLFYWGGFVHDGPDPLLVVAGLLAATTALGYVIGRLRLDSDNVWPAAVLHIVWNTVIQAGFDPATTGEGKALWTGETGILTVLVVIAVALAYRYRSPVSAAPVERPSGGPADRLTSAARDR